MYVKITSGAVDTFPYSMGQLRRDNPNTSFPRQIPNDMLAEYDVYPVTTTDAPEYDDRTQRVEQDTIPTFVDSNWTLGWTTTNKTAEEIQSWDDSLAKTNRSRRSYLLETSDWTQVADAPVDATEWATYRQALRDITTHDNWPNLSDDDWPTKPV